MQRIPTSTPDMTEALLNIIRPALPSTAKAGRTRGNESQFVQVRPDVQGHATPISRYCRVGLSVWWLDASGSAQFGEAFDLSNVAALALLRSRHSTIIHGEWQSGPISMIDDISKKEIAYSTLLLEVTSDL